MITHVAHRHAFVCAVNHKMPGGSCLANDSRLSKRGLLFFYFVPSSSRKRLMDDLKKVLIG